MFNKIKEWISKVSEKINEKINKPQNFVKNAVLSVLLLTWIWAQTKAEANIQQLNLEVKTHKIIKWETLCKISKKYWISVNILQKLNNIKDINKIKQWDTLILQKSNFSIHETTTKIKKQVSNIKLNDEKINNYSQLSNLPDNNWNKINNNSNLKNFTDYKEEINSNKEKLNLGDNVVNKYHKIYEAELNWKSIKYVISPSDKQVLFTWKHKKINWKVYVKIILSKDKNIDWFISINAFSKENKSKMSQYIALQKQSNKRHINQKKYNKKNIYKKINDGQIEETIISKNKVITNKNIETKQLLNKLLEKRNKLTLKWAKNSKNIVNIDINSQIRLSQILYQHLYIINKLPTEEAKRNYIKLKINVLKLSINYKNIPENLSLVDLYDNLCTIERMKISSNYFINMKNQDFYDNYIVAKFWWKWNESTNKITEKLWLEKNILEYKPDLKSALYKWRIEWINKLSTFIANLESKWNYNAIYWNFNQKKIDYTKMTINQVLDDMRKRYRIQKNKGLTANQISLATWRYQINLNTLKDYIRITKIDPNTQLYDKKFQDTYVLSTLYNLWLDKYINWKILESTIQLKLSQKWASIAKDESNESFHKWIWHNKAYCTNDEIDNILDELKNPILKEKTKKTSLNTNYNEFASNL